jgi:hypothetical protein
MLCYLFPHVVHHPSTQIKRGISTWLHKFATAAEKALSAEFERQGLVTVKGRADFVQFLLGHVADTSSKHRPFIWKSAYESPADSETIKLEVCGKHAALANLYLLITHVFVGNIPRASGDANLSGA